MSSTQEKLNSVLGLIKDDEDAQPSSAGPHVGIGDFIRPPQNNQGDALGRAARDVAEGARGIPASVWRGYTNAINEVGETAETIAETARKYLPGSPLGLGDAIPKFIKWWSGDANAKLVHESFIPNQSESTTGKLIETVTQFGVGMIGAGKFIKAPAAAGRFAKIGIEALKGGIVDMTVFDEYGQRLSNIIQEHPELQNPVTRFLAADLNDGAATAKLKQGLEGMLSGVALDAFTQGLKVLKNSRLLKDAPEAGGKLASDHLIATLKEADEILNSAEKGAKYAVIETEKGFQIQAKGSKDLHPVVFDTSAKANAEAGTLNMMEIEQARIQAPGQLTQEQIEAIKAESDRLINSSDPADIKKLLEGTDFNFLRVNTADDAKPWLESISKIMKDQLSSAKGGNVITHKQLLQQIGDTFPDANPEEILNALGKTFWDTQELSTNIAAGRLLMFNLGKRVSDLSKLVDGDPSNALNMARMGEALDSLFDVAAKLKGSTTNTARALESMKMDVSDIADAVDRPKNSVTPDVSLATPAAEPTGALAKEVQKTGPESVAARKILASLHGMTPDQMRTLARRIRLADGDPSAILAVAKSAPREATKKGFWDYNNEFWINAILSGPKTQIVNAVSNFSVALATPVERWAAGVFSRDRKLRDEGADLLIGNFMSLRDSWRGAVKTLKIAENGLDPFLPTNDSGAADAIGGYLGQLIRMPSRMLMSEDEFFKQMAYRSNVRMQALREARELGLSGERQATFVQDAINSAFRPGGRGSNTIGLEYSRSQTFTTALDPDSTAGHIQSWVTKHPAARVIMPFVRTPANLFYYTWERTPVLAHFNSQVRSDLAAGGRRAAIAKTKMGVGLAAYSTAATLAYMGVITGRGPSNPALRKQWQQFHQPYSIRIGDRWFEYKRVDPILSTLGIAADMVEASGEIDGDEISKVALGFAAAVASNLTSKTYLTGLSNALEAASSGSVTEMETWVKNQSGSYVPNVLAQTNPDDAMREVRGIVDGILNRLPGFSEMLPARRNLFGEPVLKAPGELNRAFNPFTVGMKSSDGGVEDKLLEIGKAISMPDPYAGTIDLRGPGRVDMRSREFGVMRSADGDLTPYDRMLQLTAEPGGGLPSLRKVLTDLVNSQQWNELSPGAEVLPGGTRLELASKRINAYRDKAFNTVRKEFPEFDRALIQAQLTKKIVKVKGEAGIEQIKQLFSTQPQQ